MIRPIAADVWLYPYLWSRQHGGGETEGRKKRPVAFVAVLPGKAGGTNLFIPAEELIARPAPTGRAPSLPLRSPELRYIGIALSSPRHNSGAEI